MRSRTKAGELEFEAKSLHPDDANTASFDTVDLVITWNGNRSATLVEVRDNARQVPIVAVTGTGRIEVHYEVRQAAAHNVVCQLQFPSKTLKKLKVEGKLGTGNFREVDSEDSREDAWIAEGVVR
jgi:hypothetical protein